MTAAVSNDLLGRLSEMISERLGLFFPPQRRGDLAHRMRAAAEELDFDDVPTCIEWFLTATLTQGDLDVLAGALTIGETYFYRDPKMFAALEQHVLPTLAQARRDSERRIRIWSAGCSTGEEPYTIAMALTRALPDLADWGITILATDINPRAIAKAMEGTYTNWSFRGTPPWLTQRFFSPGEGGRLVVRDEIKRMVTFANLNLVQDCYPSLLTNTNAVDIIFCRNVLMYFHPTLIDLVVERFHRALLDGGWLIVSPSELSPVTYSPFATTSFGDAVMFRKDVHRRMAHPAPLHTWANTLAATLSPALVLEPPIGLPPAWNLTSALPPLPAEPRAEQVPPVPTEPALQPPVAEAPQSAGAFAHAEALYAQGLYAEAAERLYELVSNGHRPAAAGERSMAMVLLVRAYANLGQLAVAREWCGLAIDQDKANPALHYLQATILLEQERLEEAEVALRRTLYLDPGFVLAHFTLGTLTRRRNDLRQATKCFANALALLRSYGPNDTLPDGEGMTAGRLVEIAAAMTQR